MSRVISNEKLADGFYKMKAEETSTVAPGQFYMLRAWGQFPLLSRPLSVFDADAKSVTFLYKLVGEGTRLLAGLREGHAVSLAGPYGNGFPMARGSIALVGGGVGIALLYMTAKALRSWDKSNVIDLYLGFRTEAFLEKEFESVADRLVLNVGGFITDEVTPADYDHIFTCGPLPMMRALVEKSRGAKAEVLVSMENRMACGIGACLGCVVKTANGNRKVCKDGPVFPAREVFALE